MNIVRGPWTESGANFDPNLVVVREQIRDYIAAEVRLCSMVGITISEAEIDSIEDKLWHKGLLKPGAHIQNAYPNLLEETAGDDLDRYYAAA